MEASDLVSFVHLIIFITNHLKRLSISSPSLSRVVPAVLEKWRGESLNERAVIVHKVQFVHGNYPDYSPRRISAETGHG